MSSCCFQPSLSGSSKHGISTDKLNDYSPGQTQTFGEMQTHTQIFKDGKQRRYSTFNQQMQHQTRNDVQKTWLNTKMVQLHNG
jgi:hypothetical protein